MSGLYERMLYISYLDADTMVLRDIQGAATVLRRGPPGPVAPVQQAPQELRRVCFCAAASLRFLTRHPPSLTERARNVAAILGREAPAAAPVPQLPLSAAAPAAATPAAAAEPTSLLALPTSGLYAGLDPAIVAALTGRSKPAQ